MKKIILFALVFSAFSALAVKRTVNNNPNYSPGQYTTMAAAITAANTNDTLYVVGSPSDYGIVTINKKLTIIGSGYDPNKQIPYSTKFSQIFLQRTITSDPSGTKIMGVHITTQLYLWGYDDSNKLSNVVITRCRIDGSLYIGNQTNPAFPPFVASVLVYNNILSSVLVSYATSYTTTGNYNISNNIIRAYINAGPNNVTSYYVATTNVYNNLFIGYGANQTVLGSNFSVYNNIFYGSGSPYLTTSHFNSVISNNLSYATTANTFYTGGTNSGSNNLVNTDPQFVSAAGLTYTSTADYHLSTGSPALTSGTSGSQIGIYGGAYPFTDGIGVGFQTSACPPVPQIYEMNMQNPLIPTTGTLSVQLKVRKVD